MSAIHLKGVIRNGHVELEKPTDLPEGTKVVVTTHNTIAIENKTAIQGCSAIEFMTEDEQSDDPQAIDRWIAELRSIPPVPENAEKEAEWRAWEERMRQFNLEAMRKQFEESQP